jgi:hypothetical protein
MKVILKQTTLIIPFSGCGLIVCGKSVKVILISLCYEISATKRCRVWGSKVGQRSFGSHASGWLHASLLVTEHPSLRSCGFGNISIHEGSVLWESHLLVHISWCMRIW